MELVRYHISPIYGGGSELYISCNDAPTRYCIEWRRTDEPGLTGINLKFQLGVVPSVGPNGVTLEALLAVCQHRLEHFQAGQFACAENAEALHHIQRALAALHRRTDNRIEQGIEGTNLQHRSDESTPVRPL